MVKVSLEAAVDKPPHVQAAATQEAEQSATSGETVTYEMDFTDIDVLVLLQLLSPIYQMLNNLVDVTQDEKDFMHLWNSFTWKKRLVADAHIPWACEAFLTEHGKGLVGTPMLTCSWRSFMTKLWKYGLIDVKTFTR
ncbi:hypothetical protein CTI12_AA596100 [Artemisia annua]|uniref:Polycomb protein VEFS-Box domain-containing protein n=1 Tax=Artemisia annua TaxID=35608 RepID=A0A2U1KIV7_ARTAN|nr:hypothetical protein CTI12_AA596100 [Artemisia annua]